MHTIGVDLGKQHDFTAASVVRSKFLDAADQKRMHFCGHLDRWREPYPKTVERVVKLANHRDLRAATLCVDQTGVGSPVVDMLRDALPGRRVIGVTITAGSTTTRGEHAHDVRVPKKLIVHTFQALMSERRLKMSNELALFPVLQTELQVFRVKITPAGNEQFGTWRERDHDDLVLSLGLAAWLAENVPGPLTDEQVRNLVLNEPASVPTRDYKSAAAGEYVRTRAEELADDLPALFGDE
ncbi:hypothetical protein J8F10_20960 [Gemmata sp. G18]|uniref:Terminase large subunit gp17-like C-terminal domain-containing protein n=1 Tax=Gemmata palustris TaxID=2822762 RepID=A0ABS5BVH7_9BACT|nr:hypothetical protein [Gemmata palustris]MBP3957729.1 hypothetical protein [Gemmata palustris]